MTTPPDRKRKPLALKVRKNVRAIFERIQATFILHFADKMRWIEIMNNIRSCVDKIVLNDIVYS